MRVILSTASGMEEAKKIARALVEEGRAACVNIVPRIFSIYFWDGELQEDEEALLIIKAVEFEPVRQRILELHSYEVPEIVALEIKEADERYAEWMKGSDG